MYSQEKCFNTDVDPKLAPYCDKSPQISPHSVYVVAQRHLKVFPVFQSAKGICMVAFLPRITLINPNDPVTMDIEISNSDFIPVKSWFVEMRHTW